MTISPGHRTSPIKPESGSRQVLLMCAPTLYTVDYVINPWMRGNVGESSRERAMVQWQRLYDVLSALADVHLIAPVSGSPDMVFTANAGLARDGVVAISRFHHPERQGEEPHFREWFAQAGYRIVDVPDRTSFEGEGDALFSVDGKRLWVGHGPRTAQRSHASLNPLWGAEVVGLRLVDPRFYHLDTCFAPLSDGSVLYYPSAFDEDSIASIEAFYPVANRIPVAEEDAVRFACNAVNLGQTVISNEISETLNHTLVARGFETIQVPLSEFMRAGGAAKCLVMKLSPELHRSHAPAQAVPMPRQTGTCAA